MGRGSSKVGGGSGSGGTNPLIQSFVDALNDPSGHWTAEQRKALNAAIYSSTDIGDAFVFTENAGDVITIKKVGINQWNDGRVGSPTLNSSELKDTLLILVNGKWSFRNK